MKRLWTILALGFFVGLAWQNIGLAATSFPKMELKLAHTGLTTMNNHKGTVKFSELVKERTGGNVVIQVFPASQLGSEKDMLEQVKTGLTQFMFTSPVQIATLEGWGPIGVLSMPYIIKGNTDEEQFANLTKLARGPLMREVNEKAAAISNVYALDMGWWFGQRYITTKTKQVIHPDDLKGLKIRTMDAPLARAAFKAFGGVAVPMAMGELYTAMQMGVVEGQENPPNQIAQGKFYEVQKYLATTGHMTMNLMLVTNTKWFQGLSPELRDVLVKAAIDAGDYQSDLQLKSASSDMELLKKNGMVVTQVNKAEFAERTKDTWKEFESLFGKGFYEKIKAAN
jgi:tripartite ATP-independent transporter DctP family solute receptor